MSCVRGVGRQRLPLRHVRHVLHELRPPLSTAVLASRSEVPLSPLPPKVGTPQCARLCVTVTSAREVCVLSTLWWCRARYSAARV